MRSGIRTKERFLSIILTIMVIISMMPSNASAEPISGSSLGMYIYETDENDQKIGVGNAQITGSLFIDDEEKHSFNLSSSTNSETIGYIDLESELLSFKDDINDEKKKVIVKFTVICDSYREKSEQEVELTNWNQVIDVELEKEYVVTSNTEGPGKVFYKKSTDSEWTELIDSLNVSAKEEYSFKFEASTNETNFIDAKIHSIEINDKNQTVTDDNMTIIDNLSVNKPTNISAVFDGYYSLTTTVNDDAGIDLINIDGESITEQSFVRGTDHSVKIKTKDKYVIQGITINGSTPEGFVDNTTEYTYNIENLSQNIELSISVVKVYTVKVDYTAENGKVSINGDDLQDNDPVGTVTGIVSGNEITIEATPNDSDIDGIPYTIKTVQINTLEDESVSGLYFDENGMYIPDRNQYSTSNPFSIDLTVDQDIEAEIEFVPFIYEAIAQVDNELGGNVVPIKQNVTHNGNSVYTISSNKGYDISSISINNIEMFSNFVEENSELVYDGLNGNIIFSYKDNGDLMVTHQGVIEDELLSVTFEEVKVTYDDFTVIPDQLVRSETDEHEYTNLFVIKDGGKVTFEPKHGYVGISLIELDNRTNQKSFSVNTDSSIDKLFVSKRKSSGGYKWFKIELSEPIRVTFDKSAPELTVEESDDYYSTEEISLHVKANDLVDSESPNSSIQDKSSALSSLKYKVTYSNVVPVNTADTPAEDVSTEVDVYKYQSEDEDVFDVDTGITIDTQNYIYADVTLEIDASDRADHKAEKQTRHFSVSKYRPEITVQSQDENLENDYYKKRSFIVSVKEFVPGVFNDSDVFIKVIKDGTDITQKIKWDEQTEEQAEKGVYTANVTFGREGNFTDDGVYEWQIIYKNKSGLSDESIEYFDKDNNSVSSENLNRFQKFVIDNEAPTGTITHGTNILLDTIEKLIFGIFSNSKMTIEAEASDNLCPEEDIKISYYKDSLTTDLKDSDYKNDSLTKTELEEKYNNNDFQSEIIEVEKDETYVVYARLEDKAGNVSYISTNGLIYDATGSGDQIEFTPEPFHANDYYNNDFNVSIKVNEKTEESGESYSGLKKINYKVKCHGETTTDTDLLDITADGYTPSKEGELLSSFEKDITISAADNNSDDVELVVMAEDNAGNSYTKSTKFKVNVDVPTVEVSFDDPEVNIYGDEGFFKTLRTATITIHDRSTVFDGDAAKGCIGVTSLDKNNEPIADSYTVGEWSHDDDNHSITVDFLKDGYYKWTFNSYTNKSGNTSEELNESNAEDKTLFNFVIDTQAPTGTITYGRNLLFDIIEKLTFGIFSNRKMTIEAEPNDNLCSLENIKVSYYKDSLTTDLKDSDYKHNSLTQTELEEKYNSNEFKSGIIEVEKDETYVVYARLEDKAGNVSYLSTNGLIYDATGSKNQIKFTPEAFHANDYYNKDFNVIIKVDEKTEESGESYSGLKKVNYKVKCNGEITTDTDLLDITSADYTPSTEGELLSSFEKGIMISASDNNSDNVELVVTAEDNAENVYTNSISLKVNVDAPTVEVSFDDTDKNSENIRVKAGRGYFNRSRTATITIIDRADTFDGEKAKECIQINEALNSKHETIEEAYVVDDEWINNGKEHTIKVHFNKNANYKWEFTTYQNKAGLNSTDPVIDDSIITPYEFTVDNNDMPTGEVILKSSDENWTSKSSELFSDSNRDLLFELFSNKTVYVNTEDIYDNYSPVEVFYYKTDSTTALTRGELENVVWTEFSESSLEKDGIAPNERFVIYLKLVDYAGNYSYINSEGCVVSNVPGEVSLNVDTQPNSNNIYGKNYLESGIHVTVTAEDKNEPYAGIKTIEYWLSDGERCSDHVNIYTFSKPNPKHGDLETTVTRAFTIKKGLLEEFNSSNTLLHVKSVDNAGNESFDQKTLDIDVTPPSIKIIFKGTKNDGSKEKYYTSREAVITITERKNHFNSDNVNIDAPAKDSNGNIIEEPFTVSPWKTDPDKDTHTATVTFSKDGNYTFNISYVDNADNMNDKVDYEDSVNYDEFTVDTKEPTGEIILNSEVWTSESRSNELFSDSNKLLPFKLFSNTTVSVSSENLSDDVSPYEVYYYKTDNTTAMKKDELDKVLWTLFTGSELEKNGVSPNEQFVVYLKLIDYAGNYRYINSEGCIVSNDPGSVSILIDTKPNSNGLYGRSYLESGIDVTVTAAENEPYAGVKSIEYWLSDGQKESKHEVIYTFKNDNPTHKDLESMVTKQININADALKEFNSCDTVLHVKSVDNAGNDVVNQKSLDIDITAPSIKTVFRGSKNDNAKDGYYTSRKAVISITERSNHFKSSNVQLIINAVDSKGNKIESPFTVSEWVTKKGSTSDEDTHTTTITFAKDGNYTFDISYIDDADNSNNKVDYGNSENYHTFTVDTKEPTGEVVLNSDAWKSESRSNELFADNNRTLLFKLFSDTAVSVSAENVADDISPYEIYFYKIDNTTAMKKDELDKVSWTLFTGSDLEKNGVSPNEQFVIYLKLIDYAGNYRYINSEGCIVSNDPGNISILIDTKPNSNGLYGRSYIESGLDVTVTAAENEPYAGVKSIEYWLTDGQKESKHEVIYSFKNNNPTHKELERTITKQINLNGDVLKEFNSCDTVLHVKSVDNAGNVSTNHKNLDIDITVPSIKADFSGSKNDNAQNGYYTSRKVVITITERSNHFKSENVKLAINAVDLQGNEIEDVYTLSEWKTKKGNTPDEDTHTATVSFVKDGNYTFDVTCADDADNKATAVNYGNSSYYKKFTVDTVSPTGTIKLDDHSWNYLFAEQARKLTFGLFKGSNITVNADIADEISPSVIDYYITDKTTSLTKAELDKVDKWNSFKGSELEKKGLTPNQRAAVYLRLTDYAGNYCYINSNGAIVDNVKSKIELKPEAPNENKTYGLSYNGKVKVDIHITDAAPYSGIKTIEYWTVDDGVASSHTILYDIENDYPNINNEDGYPLHDALKSEFTDTIEIDQFKHNSSKTELFVQAVDNAGNSNTDSVPLDIDVTKPSIKVDFSGNKNDNARDRYYTSRKAVVTVTERDNHFNSKNVKFVALALDSQGNTIEAPYAISEWTTKKGVIPDEDNHTATITFAKDGNYTFNVSYVDDADNESKPVDYGDSINYQKFTVDTLPPEGSVSLDTHSWNYLFTEVIKKLTFGFFKNTRIDVSADISDKTSPFSVEYYISDKVTALNKTELDAVESNQWRAFSELEKKGLNPNERDTVYLRLTDYAGNYQYINSNGVILDDVSSIITIKPEKPNENGIYGTSYDGMVRVDIHVSDSEPYSGIKTVECWTIDNDVESQHKYLYNIKDDYPNIDKEDGYPPHDSLKSEFNDVVVVDQSRHNSTNTKFCVKVVDNAENESIETIDLDIDVTSPSISVDFGGDVNKNAKDGYYISRKAKVVITERVNHFNSENVNFIVNALDSNGNEVEAPLYSVSEWESNIGNNPDENTHTATVTFEKDGNYTFDVNYTDEAGNECDAVDYGESQHYNKFTVDTRPPYGTVKMDEHSWNYLFTEVFKTLTFGIFKNTKIDVSAEILDLTSPYEVDYYLTDDISALSKEGLDEIDNEQWKSFSTLEKSGIEPNERVTVYLRLTDYAGNYRYINSNGAIADNISSVIKLTPEKPNENNVYGESYNGTVNVDVLVTDSEPYSGIGTVEYWTVDDGTESNHTVIYDIKNEFPNIENEEGYPLQNSLRARFQDTISISQSDHNSTDTKLYVKVVDNAGNESVENISLDVDVTAPTIKIVYEQTSNTSAVDGYYTYRQATIIVTERSNHFDPNKVKIDITSKDAKGKNIDDSWSLSEWTDDTKSGLDYEKSTHTAVLKFDKEANYTFNISCVDTAGNSNDGVDVTAQKTPFKFTVDRTSPNGTISAHSDEGRTETWNSLVDPLTYGFWSRSNITTTKTQDDEISPIKSVEYFIISSKNASDETTALDQNTLDTVSTWQPFDEMLVNENKQFVIYLKITDNAGNYRYISTNGLIVDDNHPYAESVAPEITVSPEYPRNGIYNGDVNVDIEVIDPIVGGTYSGLKEISYSVFDRTSADPNTPTQTGILYTFNGNNPYQSDLKNRWTGSIKIDSSVNNSNDIQLVIYASDNAGNAGDSSQSGSRGYCVVQIDTTAPTISVSYDNNNADNGVFFKNDRVATINITERNFNPDDVKITIENTDGVIPSSSEWSSTQGSYNGDNRVNTATITYSADGDYKFDIDYTDLAGNSASQVSYTEETVAASEFTIDKTVPSISVVYNNNSAQNGNYYNADRTATITVNEHNFDASRVNVSISATDDGKSADIPAISGWSNNGDIHTTTVGYNKDALYKFDISVKDMASNDSVDYAEESFYIDKTAPVVTISGVKDESANKGECIPIVSYSDTNIDMSKINLSLTGINRKKVDLQGSYSNIHNGRVFTFKDFSKEKSSDDIYTLVGTLTDKAGNSAKDQIHFSVNRFGSTYSLGDEAVKLNGSYTKTPVDVVLTETNANKLRNIKITVFRGNETIVLKEGTDYKIDIAGGNGKWYLYTYTIFKDVFENDGVYQIAIHSEDAAGNIAENTLDTKDMELSFGIDKTLPTINVKNVESGETYPVDNITVLVSANDNLKLQSLTIDLDGSNVAQWEESKLLDVINRGDDFTFDIPGTSARAHNLKLVAKDSAGNELVENINNFYVTTNLWVRFYTNRPLFFGTIIGIVLIALVIVFFATRKRRTQNTL